MTLLKLKAKIYRLTGIYLAHREENAYARSVEFWKEFVRLRSGPDLDLTASECEGWLIGSWQAHNGFVRPHNFKTRK